VGEIVLVYCSMIWPIYTFEHAYSDSIAGIGPKGTIRVGLI